MWRKASGELGDATVTGLGIELRTAEICVEGDVSRDAINRLLFFSFFFLVDIPASRDQFLTNLLELGMTVWGCSKVGFEVAGYSRGVSDMANGGLMNTNCEMGKKWEEVVGKIYRL